MITTIIIFYVSLLAMIGMLLLKRAEMKASKKYFLSRAGERTDHVVAKTYESVRYVLSHVNKNTAIALAQWVAFHVLSIARAIYMRIREIAHSHPHTKKVIDMVNGKVDLIQTGGASFYLKSLSEEGKK